MSTAGTYYDESLKMNGHLVTAVNLNNVTTVQFTLTSTETVVFCFDVLVGASSDLIAYFSDTNGSTWATIYWWETIIIYSHYTPGQAWSGYVNAQSFINPMKFALAGSNLTGRIWFGNKGAQGQPQVYWHMTALHSGSGTNDNNIGSGFFNAQNVNLIQFNMSAGNFVGGSIRMYRLTK